MASIKNDFSDKAVYRRKVQVQRDERIAGNFPHATLKACIFSAPRQRILNAL